MRHDDAEQKRARFESEAVPFMQALYGAAFRLTQGSDEAADLVQETYLRAYRTFDNFRPGTNCRAWLFTILYSVFINQRAKRRREVGVFPADELEERFREYVEAPAETDEELAPEIETALRALPEVFRVAVVLVDLQEMSHEEAAAALHCPVATLRTRLFRGRRLLFAALRAYARGAGYVRPADR